MVTVVEASNAAPFNDDRSTHTMNRPALDQTVVSVRNLQVIFQTKGGTVHAVKDVSFDVNPGETVCLVGESGSGKSVSALALMRLTDFSGGKITHGTLNLSDGKDRIDLIKASPGFARRMCGKRMSMVFQEPMTALNPVFTIGYQLRESIRAHTNLSRAAANARVLSTLERVRIPEPKRRMAQYPHELSGGMRQRVVIAMALAGAPDLLICDEPTTALDVTVQAEILALIDGLKRETGMAVLFITHDMAVVAQIADRIVVMHQGRAIEHGPVARIFETPQAEYTRALLAAVPRLGDMRGKPAPEPMVLADAPRPSPRTPAKAPPAQTPLLEVRNLTVRFPVKGGFLRRTVANVHAVEDVGFSLPAGQTLGLVGESGCGKSSTGRAILRLLEPHSGQIALDGTDIATLDTKAMRAARRKMQMIFQDPFASLNPQLRLMDQVSEPLRNFRLARGPALEQTVAGLFDRVHLPRAFLGRYPHEISGGQRQRVAIARALASQPKLIVADEAVSALDVSVQAEVLNLLLELQADLGLSMVFISHDMAVVERISHHTAVMYLGRIVEYGPRWSIFETPQHPYTKQLLSAVPVADPRTRTIARNLDTRPIPSPIFGLDYRAEPSVYAQAGPGHFVLQGDWGGFRAAA